jgi:SM-20-related protein
MAPAEQSGTPPPAPDMAAAHAAISPFDPLIDQLVRDGFVLAPDFLPPSDTAALLGDFLTRLENGEAHPAGIGQGPGYRVESDTRDDRIAWLDPARATPAQAIYWNAMDALRLRLNQTCFLGLKDHECHFAHYPPGSRYRRHLDVFLRSSRRRVSAVFYLNPDWTPEQGGQLRLYLPTDHGETTVDIWPEAGTLVLFDSRTLEHEVLPATRPRYSLTGWLRGE